MNTFTTSFVAVTVALVVSAFCFSACPSNKLAAKKNDDKKLFLKIGHPKRHIYVDVKSQDDFNRALIGLGKEAEVNISYVCKDGDTAQDNYNPANATPCPKAAQGSQSGAGAAGAAGDPNATQKIRSPNPDALAAVLATFAEPSTTPSH